MLYLHVIERIASLNKHLIRDYNVIMMLSWSVGHQHPPGAHSCSRTHQQQQQQQRGGRRTLTGLTVSTSECAHNDTFLGMAIIDVMMENRFRVCLQRVLSAPPCGAARISVTSIQHWEGDSSLPQKTQRASRCMGPRLLITQFARWDPSQLRGTRGDRDWKYNTQPGPTAKQRSAHYRRQNSKPSPPLHLTTRHRPGRKVWECHAIRLNAGRIRNQVSQDV